MLLHRCQAPSKPPGATPDVHWFPSHLSCPVACSEKLDVVRLTFYTAPVSLFCLAPFFWAYEVRASLLCVLAIGPMHPPNRNAPRHGAQQGMAGLIVLSRTSSEMQAFHLRCLPAAPGLL